MNTCRCGRVKRLGLCPVAWWGFIVAGVVLAAAPLYGQTRVCTATIATGLDTARGSAQVAIAANPPIKESKIWFWGTVKVGDSQPTVSMNTLTFELDPSVPADANLVVYYRLGVYPCIVTTVTQPPRLRTLGVAAATEVKGAAAKKPAAPRTRKRKE